MITTVLGGTAQSTPALLDALAPVVSQPITLRLAGRSERALRAVTRACTALCAGSTIEVYAYGATEWERAIAGSDVVIVQIRVGGYNGRAFDERFPLAHGVPGDEGLGPGGLSAACRAWPQVAYWLARVAALAPDAHVVLLTSPGSLLVHLAAAALPALDVLHPCELPATTLHRLCEALNEPCVDVAYDYAGVNHLGWLYNLHGPHGALLPRWTNGNATETFPDSTLVSALGAFPLKYLRLHYEHAAVVEEQRACRMTRAEELARLAHTAFGTFETGDAAAIRQALARRPAPWYADAVVPMLRVWLGDEVDAPMFATRAHPDIAERRYRGIDGALTEVPPSAPLAEPMAALLARIKDYERVAASAVLDGTEDALADALAAHPWVPNDGSAKRMARRIAQHAYTQRTNAPYGI